MICEDFCPLIVRASIPVYNHNQPSPIPYNPPLNVTTKISFDKHKYTCTRSRVEFGGIKGERAARSLPFIFILLLSTSPNGVYDIERTQSVLRKLLRGFELVFARKFHCYFEKARF